MRHPNYGLNRLLQDNVVGRLLCSNVTTRLLGSSRVVTLLPSNILSPTDYSPMHGSNVVDRLLPNNVVGRLLCNNVTDQLLYNKVVHRLLCSNIADRLLPTGRGVHYPRAHSISTRFLKNYHSFTRHMFIFHYSFHCLKVQLLQPRFVPFEGRKD